MINLGLVEIKGVDVVLQGGWKLGDNWTFDSAYHILIRKHRILLISWMRIHMEDKYRIYLGIVARLY